MKKQIQLEMRDFWMNKKWQLLVAGALLTSAFVAPAVEASTYNVQKGDTLTKIAQKHNTSVQNIKDWNRLTGDVIYVNQKLVISKMAVTKPAVTQKPVVNEAPDTKPKPTVTEKPKPVIAAKVENEATNVYQQSLDTNAIHTIVKGDTLTKIAQKYNTTVAQLRQWNTLTSDVIYLGQALTIQNGKASIEKDEEAVTTELPKEQTVEEMIQNQLESEQLITTRPTRGQQERYTTVLAVAQQLIGIPYVYGGNTTAGFDCSGFVSYVYSAAGFDITRKSSLDYFTADTKQVKEPVPGDFVFFKNTYIPTISHMGIYLGNDQFIHAGTKGIEIASLDTKYWADRFVAYKRYSVKE